MPAPLAWHSSVNFSDRLSNVVKIGSSYKTAYPSATPTDRHGQAKSLENEAFQTAASRVNYEERCETIIQDLLNRISGEGESKKDLIEEKSSQSGINIGRYSNAVHFSDGLFSTVYKSNSPDSAPSTGTEATHLPKVVALKVTIPSVMAPPHDSEREARLLQKAKSSNVVPLIETFHQTGGRLILVFPFMPFDMDHLLKEGKLSVVQVKSFLRNLFTALAHIHALGIIHRDVKPSNILLKSMSGPAYLADFGIAWSAGDDSCEAADSKITDVGTTSYRPPELLFGNKNYGASLDLWAAGCVVAEAVTLSTEPLFDSGDLGSELALIASIFKCLGTPSLNIWPEAAQFPDWGKIQFFEYPSKPWSELIPTASESARDLVGKLVRFESKERLTAAQALSHPYFSEASSGK